METNTQTDANKSAFTIEKLKNILIHELEAKSAKHWSDQVLVSHKGDQKLSIAKYINSDDLEIMLEEMIIQSGGGAIEQGMISVSVLDEQGRRVKADSVCQKVWVSVGYGNQFIYDKIEYPIAQEKLKPQTKPVKMLKPEELTDEMRIKYRLLLKKLIKQKLDSLWINRIGLGVDFNNAGAIQIELVEDSPKITKITRMLKEGELLINTGSEGGGSVTISMGGKEVLAWLPSQ